MMLKPDTPESRLLVDWVEGGKCLTHYCSVVAGLFLSSALQALSAMCKFALGIITLLLSRGSTMQVCTTP